MNSLDLKKQMEFFIESLSSEKGYSANTCRAYAHDLKEFVSFVHKERFSGKKNQHSTNHFTIDQVDGLTIRGYLGSLHKKNKKVTIEGGNPAFEFVAKRLSIYK